MPLPLQIVSADGVELRRAVFNPHPRGGHDIYMLVLPGLERTCIPLVHVQPSLAGLLARSAVVKFEVRRLPQNGAAMRALREQPQFLAGAALLKDGSIHNDSPSVLKSVRNRLVMRAGLLLCVSPAGRLLPYAAIWTTVCLVTALELARRALSVPAAKPYLSLKSAQPVSKMPASWVVKKNAASSESTT